MLQAKRSWVCAPWMGAAQAAVFLAALGGSAHAQSATSPDGIWYTKDQESIIRVHPCADNSAIYCGTLVWLKEPNETDGSPKVDKLNPDPSKKTTPMIGTDILLNMKVDSDHWKGSAYNPEDGKIYDITFKVKNDRGENDAADLRGCVLGFLCRTETFNRANDVPGGDPTLADAGKKHKAAMKHDAKSSARK